MFHLKRALVGDIVLCLAITGVDLADDLGHFFSHHRIHGSRGNLFAIGHKAHFSIHRVLEFVVSVEHHADDLDVARVLFALRDFGQLLSVQAWTLIVLLLEPMVVRVSLDGSRLFIWGASLILFELMVESLLNDKHTLGRIHAPASVLVCLRLCHVRFIFLFFAGNLGHPGLFLGTERSHSCLHMG